MTLVSSSQRCGSAEASAPLAVLLHGFMGDRRDMLLLQDALSASVDCVSVDLPGHGDSARVLCSTEQRLEAPLPAVDALLDVLATLCPSPRRMILIGYSLGARLAMQVAERQSGRVAAVVALSGSPGLEDAGARARRLASDEALAARLRAMDAPRFEAWLRGEWYALPMWGGLCAHELFDGLVRRRVDSAVVSALATALTSMSVAHQPPLQAWLAEAPMPLLYVAGDADAAYSALAQRLGHSCGARVRVALLPGVGHGVLTQAPDAVRALCERFVAELELPRRQPPRRPPPCEVRIEECLLRPFALPLTSALPLARGPPLERREGILLVLRGRAVERGAAAGAVGCGADVDAEATSVNAVGELCPLPGFHAESLAEASAQLAAAAQALRGQILPPDVAALGGRLALWLDASGLNDLLPSVRCAIEMATLHLLSRAQPTDRTAAAPRASIPGLIAAASAGETPQRAVQSHVRINGLLARGEMLAELEGSGGEGEGEGCERGPPLGSQAAALPRTWKLKVGGQEAEAEGQRVARVLRSCALLGLQLRLDANQGWAFEQAAAFARSLRRAIAELAAAGREGGSEDAAAEKCRVGAPQVTVGNGR